MARQVFVQVVDDIDGTVLHDGEGETIKFSVNGVDYEIDLSADNAREFHRKLNYYSKYASRLGGKKDTHKAKHPKRGATRLDPLQSKQIRKWANANGYSIGSKGRISNNILDAYSAAN